MRFYTNVQMVGDHFLVRGYENGRHFATREKFYPTLYVPSKRETKYKTLEGESVESVEPGTVRDCRDFIKKYDAPLASVAIRTRGLSSHGNPWSSDFDSPWRSRCGFPLAVLASISSVSFRHRSSLGCFGRPDPH